MVSQSLDGLPLNLLPNVLSNHTHVSDLGRSAGVLHTVINYTHC